MNVWFTDAVAVPALEKVRLAGGRLEWIQPEHEDMFPQHVGRASVDEDGEWLVELYDPEKGTWGDWFHYYPTTQNLVNDLWNFLGRVNIILEDANV